MVEREACVPGKRQVGAWQLDQLRARDVFGKEAAVLDGNEWVPVRCSTSVGAWISGRSGRASISNMTRSKA